MSRNGKADASPALSRRLVGGSLCLDLANSVDWTDAGTERPDETDVIRRPEDLTAWGVRVGLLDQRTSVSGLELKRARHLRARLHAIFASIAALGTADAGAVAEVVEHYAQAMCTARLSSDDRGWEFAWDPRDQRCVRFAAAVDAVDLLRRPEAQERVRMCPGHNCGWLFLDTTGRRRWCSMEVCGSRAKMRRLYERQRTSGRPPDATPL